MTQKLYDQLINSPRGMSTAAMRDVLLPLILGQETDGILYWIGKDLARQFPVATPGDLSLLTHQLGLGDLRLTSSHNTTMTWELSGPVIAERLALQKEATSFTLEAGFLAKQVEFQTSKVTEATVLEKKKDTVVILTESQAVTEEGEVELVTFIQPQAAATPAAAQPAPTPKAAKSPRAQRRAEKLAAKEAKKAAKRAAKEAKSQEKAK